MVYNLGTYWFLDLLYTVQCVQLRMEDVTRLIVDDVIILDANHHSVATQKQ